MASEPSGAANHLAGFQHGLIAIIFLAALAGYYLVWKYIVGFVNRVLGIA